jgi:hypothetical protein
MLINYILLWILFCFISFIYCTVFLARAARRVQPLFFITPFAFSLFLYYIICIIYFYYLIVLCYSIIIKCFSALRAACAAISFFIFMLTYVFFSSYFRLFYLSLFVYYLYIIIFIFLNSAFRAVCAANFILYIFMLYFISSFITIVI